MAPSEVLKYSAVSDKSDIPSTSEADVACHCKGEKLLNQNVYLI